MKEKDEIIVTADGAAPGLPIVTSRTIESRAIAKEEMQQQRSQLPAQTRDPRRSLRPSSLWVPHTRLETSMRTAGVSGCQAIRVQLLTPTIAPATPQHPPTMPATPTGNLWERLNRMISKGCIQKVADPDAAINILICREVIPTKRTVLPPEDEVLLSDDDSEECSPISEHG